MAEEDTGKLALVFAKQFYKHALRTIAMALAAFGFIGGTATYVLWSQPDGMDPAFAVITCLTWGAVAAAVVFAVRKPPF